MAHRIPPDSGTASLVKSHPQSPATTPLDALAATPEEHVWRASRKSPQTRRACRCDVDNFMRTLGIRSADELRRVDHKAVLAWEAYMREFEHVEASTVQRRLAALSSLFKHLIKHGAVYRNPVRDVERPPINRREGFTPAFSKAQARRLLELPPEATLAGLRDRAILSVGLQVGLRRAEIAALRVGDLHTNRGFDSLRVVPKGAKKDALAINPQTSQRIRAYLAAAGPVDHLGQLDQLVAGIEKLVPVCVRTRTGREVGLKQFKSVARLRFGLHRASMPSPKLQGFDRSSMTSLQSIPSIPSIIDFKNSDSVVFSETTMYKGQDFSSRWRIVRAGSSERRRNRIDAEDRTIHPSLRRKTRPPALSWTHIRSTAR